MFIPTIQHTLKLLISNYESKYIFILFYHVFVLVSLLRNPFIYLFS